MSQASRPPIAMMVGVGEPDAPLLAAPLVRNPVRVTPRFSQVGGMWSSSAASSRV